MKKIAIIILAVLWAASLSPAGGKITFGVKAGSISANMPAADTAVEWSAKWGITGGAFACFVLDDVFSIQPEILYSPKGARHSDSNGASTTTLSVSAPYIDVPVLLKAFLPLGSTEGLRPTVFAGPYFGFKAGKGKYQEDVGGGGQHSTSEVPLTNLKGVDFGVVLGAGAEFPVGGMRFTFDIRWGTSLPTISSAGDNLKNKAWSFLLGLSFS